jgi:hypothetical protein
MNQSAESIAPADAIEPARSNDAEVWSGLRRRESESAMRAMSVVVLDVHTEDALKLALAEDEDPVEALATDRADEPLGERIRLRRLEGRSDDLDPLAPEDLIERLAELAVAIVDQKTRRRGPVGHVTGT